MVFVKLPESAVKSVEGLLIRDHRDCDTHTLLLAAGGGKRNRGNTLTQQLLLEISPFHIAVANGKEEAVGNL